MLQDCRPLIVGSFATALRNEAHRTPGDIDIIASRESFGNIRAKEIKQTHYDINKYWIFLEDGMRIDYDTNYYESSKLLKEASDTKLLMLWHMPVAVIGPESQHAIKRAWSEYGATMHKDKHLKDLEVFSKYNMNVPLYDILCTEIKTSLLKAGNGD